MTKTYNINLEGKGSTLPVRVLNYEHDDGVFVGNCPTTDMEREVIEHCKGLVREVFPFSNLKITIEQTE